MIMDSISSMKDNISAVFFNWVTYYITAMFVFLFFTVAMSPGIDMTIINSRNDLPTNLTIYAVILCSINIVFANHFYIKRLSTDLAVREICGATYGQLVLFLLTQSILIYLLAIPVGLLIGNAAIPFLNHFFSNTLHTQVNVQISFRAIFWTVIVLAYVIFWTLILDLSFIYKNSPTELFNETKLKIDMGDIVHYLRLIPKKIVKYLSLFFWVSPLLGCHLYRNHLIQLTLVSLAAFIFVIYYCIIPKLNSHILNHIDDALVITSVGFFRADIKMMRLNLLLLITSSVLLTSMLASTIHSLEIILVVMTYAMMNLVLFLAIVFRFSSDITTRISRYKTLIETGFTNQLVRRTISKEVCLFYLFVGTILTLYQGNMYIVMMEKDSIDLMEICILSCVAVIPLLVSAFITYLYYKKYVMEHLEG